MADTILLVEDESAIREMVTFALERAGFSTVATADAAQAQAVIERKAPNLILLDWMLPGLSGVDFARRLKKEEGSRKIPIIMLTARGEEMDKVRGFELGVDDYVTKPFSPRELVARIKAVLRRAAPEGEEKPIEVEGLWLDPVSHRVTAGGTPVELGPTEFRMLHFFMSHPERVYSRGQLLDKVWGNDVYIEERTVDVHIRRLRKALVAHGHDRLIQTVRGAGYRFSVRS
ncbi:MAG: phosphate regulon transcriptional regulator PhoB [Gammaproteobacteria bacterium]|nr:phosphate regulon transcriptional regulator PhoB [Gammaproteobacteria bacterium]